MKEEMLRAGWKNTGEFWYLPEDGQLMTFDDAAQFHRETKKKD